jgi:hypothetical protein
VAWLFHSSGHFIYYSGRWRIIYIIAGVYFYFNGRSFSTARFLLYYGWWIMSTIASVYFISMGIQLVQRFSFILLLVDYIYYCRCLFYFHGRSFSIALFFYIVAGGFYIITERFDLPRALTFLWCPGLRWDFTYGLGHSSLAGVVGNMAECTAISLCKIISYLGRSSLIHV